MLLFTKKINDSAGGDAEQPRALLLDRLGRIEQLVEDLLQDVVRVGGIRDAAADEIAQPPALALECFLDAQCSIHRTSRRAGQTNIFDAAHFLFVSICGMRMSRT